MYPESAAIVSLKVITRLLSKVTVVESSSGDRVEIVGAVADEILSVARLPDEAEGVYSITYGRRKEKELSGKSFQFPMVVICKASSSPALFGSPAFQAVLLF